VIFRAGSLTSGIQRAYRQYDVESASIENEIEKEKQTSVKLYFFAAVLVLSGVACGGAGNHTSRGSGGELLVPPLSLGKRIT
jgi:hypothetical protein